MRKHLVNGKQLFVMSEKFNKQYLDIRDGIWHLFLKENYHLDLEMPTKLDSLHDAFLELAKKAEECKKQYLKEKARYDEENEE